MRINIANLGTNDIRVILDHDNVHDFLLKAGTDDEYESDAEGVIELREFGGAPDDLSEGDTV
jgi:hypothetical protein